MPRFATFTNFNEEMIKYETVLKELEIIRYNFSRAFGRLISSSGSIVAQKANLSHSLTGLLYISARDTIVNIFLI
jgi:hypothetical protein